MIFTAHFQCEPLWCPDWSGLHWSGNRRFFWWRRFRLARIRRRIIGRGSSGLLWLEADTDSLATTLPEPCTLCGSGVVVVTGKIMARQNFATNRKARFEYEILEKVEAGIVLLGTEVKSIRNGKMSLDGSFATVEGGEVFLIDSNVEEYKDKGMGGHEPKRKRKLLLHKSQIEKLAMKADEQGHTLIPLSAYSQRGVIKIELAVAKGKKLYDKRETIKKREAQREMKDT